MKLILKTDTRTVSADIPNDSADDLFNQCAFKILGIDFQQAQLEAPKLTKEEIYKNYYSGETFSLDHDYVSDEPKKKLIIVKCKDCGNTNAHMVFINDDGTAEYTCRNCDAKETTGTLKYSKYQCPNCGQTMVFRTDGSIMNMECKNCGSPIDLIYNESKDVYKSANLLE